jgi:hypothetical protein
MPVLVAAAVALAAVVVLLLRGRRGRATRVLAEGACPVCLAAGLLGGAGRPAPAADAPGRDGAPGPSQPTTPSMMERPAEVRRALRVRRTALHVQAGVAGALGTSPPRLVGAVAPVVPG